MGTVAQKSIIATRFRGYLPVVVDVETGGFNANTDALLEIAAQIIETDTNGRMFPGICYSAHVIPFAGANIEPDALAVNGIDPGHPFRFAVSETEALRAIFRPVRRALETTGCQRAVLVGHNASFDLGFLNAAIQRTGIKHNPFHQFSSFDTATLAGLACGQTVLALAVQAAGFEWNANEAHSAIYDTERTAALFCHIVNRWDETIGSPAQPRM